jgi:hypothetical protein
MTLQKWLEFGWLRPHQTSRAEILDLLSIVDRDLIAYNAALKLCTVLLFASGYRAGREPRSQANRRFPAVDPG